MQKRTEIRLTLLYTAAILLILTFIGDFLRGKSLEFGKFQLLGCGIGTGIMLMCMLYKKEPLSWKKPFFYGLIVIFLDAILAYFLINTFDFRFIYSLTGILAGLALGFIIIGLLLRNIWTASRLMDCMLFATIVFPFVIWIFFNYIQLDLWYDEVYSLNSFILVPVVTSITDYHAPNNHIFFSLIANLYMKAIGIQDINVLIDHIYQLRLLMFVFSFTALLCTYITLKKFVNRLAAAITLIILVTTIPFYNFAVQIRGYGLTILLICILLFHLWSYEIKPGRKSAILIAVLSALIIYTIPTNFYFLGSIAVFYITMSIIRIKPTLFSKQPAGSPKVKIMDKFRILFLNKYFQIVLFIGTGSLAASLLYLPVLEQLTNNPLIREPQHFLFPVLFPRIPETLALLLCGRILLLLTTVAGLIIIIYSKMNVNKKNDDIADSFSYNTETARESFKPLRQVEGWLLERSGSDELNIDYLIAFSGISMLAPFFFSYLHGYNPYYRVFLFITPMLALFLALCVYRIYIITPYTNGKSLFSIAFLFIYCYATFIYGLNQRDHRLLADITNNQISQNLTDNYYQAYYHPYGVFKNFAKKYWQEDVPVFVNQQGDTQAIPLYASKFLDSYDIIASPGDIYTNKNKGAYIITAHPSQFIKEMKAHYPKMDCNSLNETPQYIEALFCECNSDSPFDSACPRTAKPEE